MKLRLIDSVLKYVYHKNYDQLVQLIHASTAWPNLRSVFSLVFEALLSAASQLFLMSNLHFRFQMTLHSNYFDWH